MFRDLIGVRYSLTPCSDNINKQKVPNHCKKIAARIPSDGYARSYGSQIYLIEIMFSSLLVTLPVFSITIDCPAFKLVKTIGVMIEVALFFT